MLPTKKRSTASRLQLIGTASVVIAICLYLFVEPFVHFAQGATNWLHFARGFFIGFALVALIAGLFARRNKPSCCD